jgi:DNA mismatch endonuclease (patch repair protein)
MARNAIPRWVLRPRDLFGSPDSFFEESKLAIFVDGRFWHGCPRCGYTPKANFAYWKRKIECNRLREIAVNDPSAGGTLSVLALWKSETQMALQIFVDRISNQLVSDPDYSNS